MIFETILVGAMQVNCYILASKDFASAIIIDPGDQERKIRQVLAKHSLEPAFVINTHGHYDHIGCDNAFGVPIYVHVKDAPLLVNPMLNLSGLFALPYKVKSQILEVRDNDLIKLDDIVLQCLHLPGHTAGGMALALLKPKNDLVFTGDTLFYRAIGRSDLEGGDGALLVKSIREKLFSLPDATQVFPGHGPSSTIGEEKQHNPFFS